MNKIPNPYFAPYRPRHRARRRLILLAVLCVTAVLVVLLSGCQPPEVDDGASTTPQESTAPANPGGGAVSLSTTPLSASTGAQSDQDFYAWYTASERNAVWYHIRDEFGTGHIGDQAVRVAECESGLDPQAVSPTNDHGVFQINAPSWQARFDDVTGQTWSPNVYHASHNAAFAHWLVDETGGWSHWACRP